MNYAQNNLVTLHTSDAVFLVAQLPLRYRFLSVNTTSVTCNMYCRHYVINSLCDLYFSNASCTDGNFLDHWRKSNLITCHKTLQFYNL